MKTAITLGFVCCGASGCFVAGVFEAVTCEVDDDCDGGRVCAVRTLRCVNADKVGPSSPAGLRIESLTDSSALLSFIAPGDDGAAGGTSADLLVVRFHDVDGAVIEERPLTNQPATAGQTQRTTLNALSAATEYFVSVTAFDDVDNRADSEIISFITDGVLACVTDDDCAPRAGTRCGLQVCTDDVTPPAPPADLEWIPGLTTRDAVTFAFIASGDDGDTGTVRQFAVTASNDAGSITVEVAPEGPAGTSTLATVTGLTPGPWTITVIAEDDAGLGSAASRELFVEVGGAFCGEDRVASVAGYTARSDADLVPFVGCTTLRGSLTIENSNCSISAAGADLLSSLTEVDALAFVGGGLNCRLGVSDASSFAAVTSGNLRFSSVAFTAIRLPALRTGLVEVFSAPQLEVVDLPSFAAGTVVAAGKETLRMQLPAMTGGTLAGAFAFVEAPLLATASLSINDTGAGQFEDFSFPSLESATGEFAGPRLRVPVLATPIGSDNDCTDCLFVNGTTIDGNTLALTVVGTSVPAIAPSAIVVSVTVQVSTRIEKPIQLAPLLEPYGPFATLRVRGRDRSDAAADARGVSAALDTTIGLETDAHLPGLRIAPDESAFQPPSFPFLRTVDALDLDPDLNIFGGFEPARGPFPRLERVGNEGFDAQANFGQPNPLFRFVSGAAAFVDQAIAESYFFFEVPDLDEVLATTPLFHQTFDGTVGDPFDGSTTFRIRGSGLFTSAPTGSFCLDSGVEGFINEAGDRCLVAAAAAANVDIIVTFAAPPVNAPVFAGAVPPLAGVRLP